MDKITLGDLIVLIPETQIITILCGDMSLTGSAESINIWSVAEVLKAKVANIEPLDDTLRIWLEVVG